MRKRSRYKPKPVLVDPLGYVLESTKPVVEHDTYVLDWKLRNNEAFAFLLKGQATRADLDTLTAAHNITEALIVTLDGKDIDGTVARSAVALMDICDRANAGKGTAMKAPEIQAMRDLMGLHDELLDVVTIRQLETAVAYAKKEIAAGRANRLKEVNV